MKSSSKIDSPTHCLGSGLASEERDVMTPTLVAIQQTQTPTSKQPSTTEQTDEPTSPTYQRSEQLPTTTPDIYQSNRILPPDDSKLQFQWPALCNNNWTG